MSQKDSDQETGNVRAAFGHDAPVFYRTEDLYDRWPLATAISRVITSSPLNWSTRIGLYGPWGDGKTSVLNLLEKQQSSQVVIRFSPWGASTEDEIWSGFAAALRNGLKKARASQPFGDRAMYVLRRSAPWLAKAIGAAGKGADAKAPGISAGADFAANLIEKHLKVSRKDVQAMAEILADRRVIVLIDDLDRTDPKVIPKLLLALRDLLDFSRFTFVLAFDHKVVAKAITSHNPAWQSAESFLDKIIDFPFDLPAPTRLQVERLARDQFSKLCPFVPAAALDTVIPLIPANPRRLKLLGRIIASTRDEAARHSAEEINWNIVIIFAMLRIECSPLATELLDMSIDMESDDAQWLHWVMENDEREEKGEEATKDLIARHLQGHNEIRIRALIKAWRDSLPTISGEGLRYQATFTISPQSITWGEFKAFLVSWRSSRKNELLLEFVTERGRSSAQPRSNVSAELVDAVIGHYAAVLEHAAQVQVREAHRALIDEASDILDLARFVFIDRGLPHLNSDLLFPGWTRFRSVVLQWLHFTSNQGEAQLRAKEVRFLSEFASSLNRPLDVYEVLKPWEGVEDSWDQRESDLKEAFSSSLLGEILDDVCEKVLEHVRAPGQLKRIRTTDTLALRHLLCSPDSPLFTGDRKASVVAALEERRDGTFVAEDAIDYLSILLSALRYRDPICPPDERQKFIVDHSDFMALLWDLVISRPSQFRGLGSLRKMRDTLIANGIDKELLPAPEWLDAPRADTAPPSGVTD